MIKDLIQTQCPALLLGYLVCATSLLSSCANKASDSPEGYNINKARSTELGKVLNEISGIFYHAGDSGLLAISDNQEKIIGISLKENKLRDVTKKVVDKGSDLEDIVMVDSTIYILKSVGIVKAVKPGAQDSSQVIDYILPLPGKNDFETMYYEPSQNALILICKSCETEKGTGMRSAYKFSLDSKEFDTSAIFTVSQVQVEEILKESDANLAPSAAAIHPITQQLYILSSAGNLLVVANRQGKVLNVYKLNPDTFQQAEGIAFAPDGDMYISNEGKLGKPTLLYFPYNPAGKKNK
jgi:uncharacterized protein YjiK